MNNGDSNSSETTRARCQLIARSLTLLEIWKHKRNCRTRIADERRSAALKEDDSSEYGVLLVSCALSAGATSI